MSSVVYLDMLNFKSEAKRVDSECYLNISISYRISFSIGTTIEV